MRPKKFHPMVLFIYGVIVFFIGIASRASTFHDALPGAKLNASEAQKLMATDKPVFRCTQIQTGPRINPIKVKGTNDTFHTSVGKPIENVVDRLASGGKTWRCDEVYISQDSARVRKK